MLEVWFHTIEVMGGIDENLIATPIELEAPEEVSEPYDLAADLTLDNF